jgi:hypothetical protein
MSGTKVEIVQWGSKEIFMQVVDKNIGVIGITDENFKNGIKNYLSSTTVDVP